jgi:hypothetical protein
MSGSRTPELPHSESLATARLLRLDADRGYFDTDTPQRAGQGPGIAAKAAPGGTPAHLRYRSRSEPERHQDWQDGHQ